VVAVGVLLAYALRAVARCRPRLHASGAQTAFRFNSYVALALAERLAGRAGRGLDGAADRLCVPLCNVAAVWPLARHGGHGYLRELLRNPLILATVAGWQATCWAALAGGWWPHAAAHRRWRRCRWA
jgi:malonate transporter and related proteins